MSGSASLDAPNFMYKKQNVFGEAQATYVLGIGGVARQSLIVEAKKNMLKANPLLKNQALANVSVSYKSTGFLGIIVVTVKCNVSADIVEFGSMQTDFSQSDTQSSSVIVSKDNNSKIETKSDNKNVAIEIKSDNKNVAIETKSDNKKVEIDTKTENKKVEIDTETSLKIGDKVNIISYYGRPFKGPVVGKVFEIQKNNFIIEYTTKDNKTDHVKVPKSQVQKVIQN
jgi:hypothetical protein